MFSWAGDTIWVEEPEWVTERGKTVATYPGINVTEVPGCSVQDGAASNDRAGRDNIIFDLLVLAPAWLQVSRHAKITANGQAWKIEGKPGVWRSPTGSLNYTELKLIDWEG